MHKIKTITVVTLLIFTLFIYPDSAQSQSVLFEKNLAWGSTDKVEVSRLQKFLSEQGFYKGSITGGFYKFTYNAVVAFQKKHGVIPASGYFATSTRGVANQILLSSSSSNSNITTVVDSSSVNTTQLANVIASTSNTSVTNLVANPSMEIANGSKPDKWSFGKWGTNTANFVYSTNGQDGNRSLNVNVTSYTSGDAKWFFDDVTVTPGTQYTFSEYYKSNVVTNVTVRWTSSTGAVTYQSLGNPPAATNWTLRTNTITVPAGVTKMTVFHVIKRVGTLDIDNFVLTKVNPTATTTGAISVDAIVSPWSAWGATSDWTVCSNGTQNRNEKRTRTVVNSAINGGVTPVLIETRVVSQACTVPSSLPNTTSTSTIITQPISNILNYPKKEWGAYVGWEENNLSALEALVGKTAQYRAVFIHWGNESKFPQYLKASTGDKGKTLVIFWEANNYNVDTVNQTAYNYDSIINGNWDVYFTQFAKDAAVYGAPVILIPFSEMNGNWFPWSITLNGNSPQKHIDAFRHIHGFFKNAPNVKFGWAPNHEAVPDTTINKFEGFYPGDAYVDYVGLDGFNFNNPWMTFDQVFGNALGRIKAYNKPVFIFSFASAQGPLKPAWITDALTIQIYKYPEIKGWIWFNESKERDWRIDSDPASLNSFKSALSI